MLLSNCKILNGYVSHILSYRVRNQHHSLQKADMITLAFVRFDGLF